MDDVLDDTTDVTVLLGEVESTESRGGLVQVRVRLEDTSGLSLVLDDTLREGKGGEVVRGCPRGGTRALGRDSLPWLLQVTGRTEDAEKVSKQCPQERTNGPSPQTAALDVQSSPCNPPACLRPSCSSQSTGLYPAVVAAAACVDAGTGGLGDEEEGMGCVPVEER